VELLWEKPQKILVCEYIDARRLRKGGGALYIDEEEIYYI